MEIPQTTFKDGRIPEDCTWKTVVIISKGNGEFRGIGLVEVIWKAFSGAINQRIGGGVQFHNVLHG